VVTDLPDTVASALSQLAEYGVDRFSDQLNISPVFIGRLSLSIEEIWETTVSLDPSIEAIANSGLSVLGVDFDKDILENVNGNVSIIIGSEVAQDNLPTTVIHAEVRNPSPLESLVQSACPMLLTHMGFSSVEGDEGTACESEFGSFGILDRYIIASNNPGIVRGDLTSGGLTAHLPQAAWQQQLEGAPLSIYLNVKGIMDLLSDGTLTSAINSNPFIDPAIGNQVTTYRPNIERDTLPIEAIGLSMSHNSADLEITGQLYPTDGSFTEWIGGGLELLLTPQAAAPHRSTHTERELASAVESLAGAVSVYHMFEGSYLSCGENDVSDGYRADPRQWVANPTLVDCLEGELEWSISDAPPGVYWVTVADPDSNEPPFVAHGLALFEEEFVYFQAGPNGQAVKSVQ
jgi:hypothetical protein